MRIKIWIHRSFVDPYRIRPVRLALGVLQLRWAVRRGADLRPAIETMARGWGNQEMAAAPDYVTLAASDALAVRQPVLECGSGLTTLVLAAVTRSTDQALVSLEQHPAWAARVKRRARRCGLGSIDVRVRPLVPRGDVDWYDVKRGELPKVGLVVCDGPPGSSTRGGRHGILGVIAELGPPELVLLDDAARPSEQELSRLLAERFGYRPEVGPVGLNGRGYARLALPAVTAEA